MKNPTLATVLNIIPGLGYIYLGGQKRIFGIILLLGIVASSIASFDPLLYSEAYLSSPYRIWDWLAFASLILLVGGFMYDGYASANLHNASLSKSKK